MQAIYFKFDLRFARFRKSGMSLNERIKDMKKFYFISFIIQLLIFPGCLEIKTLITVDKDGSGTIEETLVMSEKVVEMMKGFSSAFTSDSVQQQPEFNLFDENNLKERAGSFGNGVTYISSEKIQDGKREGYRALYAFENLEDISLKKIPQNEMPIDLTEAAGKDLSFKFLKGSPSEIIISFPDVKDSAKQNEMRTDSVSGFNSSDSLGSDSALTKETLDLIKDLKISLVMRTEGSIVETNASYQDGNEITLVQFDFSKLMNNPESLNELFKLKSQNLEEINRIVGNIPGMKIQMSKEIHIKFE